MNHEPTTIVNELGDSVTSMRCYSADLRALAPMLDQIDVLKDAATRQKFAADLRALSAEFAAAKAVCDALLDALGGAK